MEHIFYKNNVPWFNFYTFSTHKSQLPVSRIFCRFLRTSFKPRQRYASPSSTRTPTTARPVCSSTTGPRTTTTTSTRASCSTPSRASCSTPSRASTAGWTFRSTSSRTTWSSTTTLVSPHISLISTSTLVF
ncbi:unnamed protein product [Prunus brigantina]